MGTIKEDLFVNIFSSLGEALLSSFVSSSQSVISKVESLDLLGTASKKYVNDIESRFNYIRVFGMERKISLREIYVRVNVLERITHNSGYTKEQLHNIDLHGYGASVGNMDGSELISKNVHEILAEHLEQYEFAKYFKVDGSYSNAKKQLLGKTFSDFKDLRSAIETTWIEYAGKKIEEFDVFLINNCVYVDLGESDISSLVNEEMIEGDSSVEKIKSTDVDIPTFLGATVKGSKIMNLATGKDVRKIVEYIDRKPNAVFISKCDFKNLDEFLDDRDVDDIKQYVESPTTLDEIRKLVNIKWKNRSIFLKEPDFDSLREQTRTHLSYTILGQPGRGKTTFLKFLLLSEIDNPSIRSRIPVFISLRDFARRASTIRELIEKEFHVCDFNDARLFVERMLESGYFLILFDALDEIESARSDDAVIEIQELTNKYRKNQFILSCRTAAYISQFSEFTDVEIAEFSNDEVKVFANNWFEDRLRSAEFIGEVRRSRFADMAKSPLLLTLMCLSFQSKGEFPTNNAEMYKDATEALLTKWDSSRQIRRTNKYKELNFRGKERLFSQVAYSFFVCGEIYFEEHRLSEVVSQYLTNINLSLTDHEYDMENLLESIESQHGILVRRTRDYFSFSHLTFQEYYVVV